MIKFYCDACRGKLGVPDDYATKLVRCTRCSAPVRVPNPAAPAHAGFHTPDLPNPATLLPGLAPDTAPPAPRATVTH